MPTLEERMAGLQAAQGQGQPVPPPEEVAGPIAKATNEVMGSFNIGLSNFLGAPVDAVNSALIGAGIQKPDVKPVLGSAQIRDFLEGIGSAPTKENEPKGFIPRAARIAGETIVPSMGVKALGASLSTKAPQALNDLQKSLVAAYQRPWITAGAEATTIAGAALGGEVAATVYPDNYVAQMFGELLGGITPSAAISLGSYLPGPRVVKDILSGEGAQSRAAKRIQEVASDIDKARIAALSGETILKLDPITATGDAGLLALEKAAIESDPKLAARVADATDMSYYLARKSVMAGGDPQATIRYLNAIRVNTVAKAQTEISKLKTDVDPITASRIIRKEVEASLKRARQDENAIWQALPTKGAVDPSNVANTFSDLLADRSFAANPEDIPSFVYELVGSQQTKNGVTTFVPGKAIKSPELGVMKDLRSRIQQEVAAERAKDAPNRNKIRILGELQESIYDTIANTSPEYKEAVDFSRNLNQQFTRGKIGDLLGYERTGELTTSQEGTLDFLVSGNKDDVRMGIRQLATAAPEAIPAFKEGIKGMFMIQTVDPATGALNVSAARRFLKNNQHTLEEFPEIRTQIEQSIKSQKVTDELFGASVGSNVSTYVKDKAVASLYLDGTPDSAMHRLVTAKNSQGAGATMKQMLQLTNQDPTGRATKGLKAAFGQYLLRHSETGDINVLSGKKYLTMLDHLKESAAVLYTPDELDRLRRIGAELRMIEARESAAAAKGGVISDLPNKIISIVGGTYASRLGAQLGGSTSGASLRTASIMSREYQEVLGRLTNDGATQILLNAVEDPLVLRTLLKEATPANLKEANKVFNSFLTGSALSTDEKSQKETLEDRLNRLARDSRENTKAMR